MVQACFVGFESIGGKVQSVIISHYKSTVSKEFDLGHQQRGRGI